MKVAILAPITWPIPPISYGPWEKVVYTLAQGLAKKGIDVTVFATDETYGDFKHEYIFSKTLSQDGIFGHEKELIHISESIKRIKASNFDIVNNHLFANGHIFLEQSNLPFVTTLHGNTPESNFIFNKYKDTNYISISKSLQEYNPNLNYISNVYNGIDFDYFTPESTHGDYLVSTARIHPDKGIHNAIELAHNTNLKLYIAGIIHDQTYFDTLIKPHIDNKQIFFMENISQIKVKELVSHALAYVSLIEWEEPFGLSVAESIACGVPVIATKRGSMNELVVDGVTGILVNNILEASERINELYKIDKINCRNYGYKMFSLDQMIDGYYNAFKVIC